MSERRVAKLVQGQPTSDGAGVRLTRLIGTPALPELDPFLLLDEFKSDRADDYAAGFPDHPHRGFETVTYMLAGAMEHRDHAGHHGEVRAGSVQWMTAGRGIVHSEMPRQRDGLLWGFQLWVNLPARDKMMAPRYQDVPPERIPDVALADGVVARVIAGAAGGVPGPVEGIVTQPVYLDVRLARGSSVALPITPGHNAFACVYEGRATLGSPPSTREVVTGQLATLTDGASLRVAADAGAPARLLVLAARPLGEPVARYGPFVVNTREELAQAVDDYRSGRF